ncbi:MAG: hypothetical protein AAGI53_13540 [Planctomycetota bacterium]
MPDEHTRQPPGTDRTNVQASKPTDQTEKATDGHNLGSDVPMLWFVIAGVVGVTMILAAACLVWIPEGFARTPFVPSDVAWWGLAIGLLSLGLFGYLASPYVKLIRRINREAAEPERSRVLYGKYLSGLGFALLLDAIVCASLIASLASSVGFTPARQSSSEMRTNIDGDSFDATAVESLVNDASPGTARVMAIFGRDQEEIAFVVVLLFLSTLVSLLGALFFFANSLWRRLGDPDREPFDGNLFWAGLWFRLAEAVIFNLVLFFALRFYAPDQYFTLPLVALLIGMFLKSGEKLVTGIAERVFAAFDALIPTRLPKATQRPKLLTIKIDALFDSDGLSTNGAELVAELEALHGVERAIADRGLPGLRIEFDTNIMHRSRLLQLVRVHGLTPETGQGV